MTAKKKIINDKEFNHGLYKYTKNEDITFESILAFIGDNGACQELTRELKKIISEYGVEFGDMSFKDMMEIVVKEERWIEWLEENEFIEKDTSVDICIGDVFTMYNEPHMLININGDSVCLVSLKDGETCDPVDVEDTDRIEPDEIFEIFDIDKDEVEDLQEILESRIPSSSVKISKKGK